MGFLNEIRDLPLALAATGLPVFPCYDCPDNPEKDKKPATRHAWKDATTDPAVIGSWWWHNRLIAVPTGAVSGFVVLDIDPRHNGHLWLEQHRHRLPETRIHSTRRGGQHWVYQHPGYRVSGNQGVVGKGVDIRGDGNYVIWWPTHGGEVVTSIGMDRLAPWPAWLQPPERPERPDRPTTQPAQRVPDRRSIERLLQFVADSEEGERNGRLFWAACRMGEMIMPPLLDEARAVALLVNATEVTGTSLHEARRTALSGLHAAAKRRAVT